MNSKTPRTDEKWYSYPMSADCHGENYNVVRLKYARQLEEENIAMRQAISTATECIAGLDLHLPNNYGLFILMALDKLQPYAK